MFRNPFRICFKTTKVTNGETIQTTEQLIPDYQLLGHFKPNNRITINVKLLKKNRQKTSAFATFILPNGKGSVIVEDGMDIYIEKVEKAYMLQRVNIRYEQLLQKDSSMVCG